MLGYMLTWTTYGTWLQGDDRGYVLNGKVLNANPALRTANLHRLKNPAVFLTPKQREVVYKSILDEAKTLGQEILAAAVDPDHVHLVAKPIPKTIGRVVAHYKNAARITLRSNGLIGRVWTKGFDKRFCYNRQDLQSRIVYVTKHKKV
jgi:REP element-mobilizing transposase RayT